MLRHYRLRGYRLLGANVRAGGYELDLVLRRGGLIVVCEVKMRTGSGYGRPQEAVGVEKARRLRRATEAWLAGRRDLQGLDLRLEVVAVEGRRIERLPLD